MKGGLRLDVLRVHGFGHFSGYELELGPGLNLLYGPNEAGKSTLLSFIRGMLFGLEKRGRSESRYEPEAGTFGGELCVSSGAGPLVVRRVADRRGKAAVTVLSPEGHELLASRLDEALAHVSRELFCEVFAFSLDELSSFEKLAEEDGVSRALFAAGLRGARRLPEVEKHLEKRAGELFKVSGKNPELNQVLRQLDEVRAQLDTLKDRPEKYFEERERLASLGRQQEEAAALQENIALELERLSRLEAALGDLGELARLRAELATLPDLSAFPMGGEARLEELLQRSKEAWAQQARVEDLLSTSGAELDRLSAASAVREREVALRSALVGFTARAELLRALPGRRAALEARRREVEQALGGLGLEVDAVGLLALELGAAARGSLEALADRWTKAEGERREAEVALGRVRVERERFEASLARLQAERAKLPDVSAAELRQRQAALGRARLLRVERDQVAAQRAELQQRLQSLRAQAEPEPGAAPAPWTVLLGVGVAVVWVGAMWLHAGVVEAAMALLGALLLVVPLALGYRRSVRSHQQTVESHATRQHQRAQELARLQSALDTLSGRLVGLDRELAAAASEAGVAAQAAAAALAGADAALAEALRQAERVEHLEREREAREAERDGVVREAQSAEVAGRRADMLLRTLRAELAALLDARGFPTDLSPQRALALWRDVAEQRQRLADLRADERAQAVDEAACHAIVSRLLAEARAAGLPEGPAESVAAQVASALEELKARDVEARALRARRDEWAADKARFTRLRESEEQAVAALLAQGGGDTEETFRQRARQAERFESLTRRVRELSGRIEAATGLSEEVARESILAAGGEERLKEKLGQLRMQEPACAERLKVLHTEYGAARSQLAQWESDEQLATLRIQEEQLRARAAELATRYAADRLGLALLARARRRFEEEQQPRVIQLASEHFAALTGGRYRRVFVPAGGKRELRVSDARRDWSAEQLSRGTREQLYLAFRLAVIQDFGETRGALPLILDDILVNFDLERTRGTLRLLASLSEHHQVIAFTCHPWLRELFEAEGARVVELAPGGPTKTEAASPRGQASGVAALVGRQG
ncbi:AAA family ATPase [Vitiosangium sp. GDMCC 1.1324]|uniref:AAA family ATPase n=1 Tax=Vitiosangium sp. (strain GDMCC 1.1324) TaxID=2138576 RepID=UPI000D38D960|nr:AAA family ATPase [Vitiosangium sp. GDMCC 1.1324]PTL81093.1 DNA repair protein Rad50 [Vitiosangium sp. GDMCC 1.1324]